MSNPKKCVGKESFQRINYLLQLTNEIVTENYATHIASLQYSNLAVNISKKAVQRMDLDIKRNICKRCRSLLIPGITSKTRIKKKRIIVHCTKCNAIKIFPTQNKTYKTWSQTEESLVEVLDYTPKK